MLYGFDVGGTKIVFCVYDKQLNCLFEQRVATPSDYDSLVTVITQMVQSADIKFSVKGNVGIGLPGTVGTDGMSRNCANVPALQGHFLIADLSSLLDREIKAENDANCFLISECKGGSANGCDSVLAITLGTGLGGAVFSNGKILSGKNSFAGEIGHYPIAATLLKKYPELPEFTCSCGRLMCLETYVSGTGLANLYAFYAKQSLQGPAILDKYRAGDKTAIKVLSIYFDILASGIATAMLVLDAEAIIFGGGLSKFEILVSEFSKRLPEYLLTDVELPIISVAKFGGEGGVRGAALLNY